MPDLPEDWSSWRDQVNLTDYDARWARLAAAGHDVHGEADLVTALLADRSGARVLDGGCGTGRVAIELDHRGFAVVGVDADADMIAAARAKAPGLAWLAAGLQELGERLPGERFDLVVLAGNVIPYVAAPDRAAAVAGCAGALGAGGLLVAGFSLRPGWPTLADHDGWCAAAGLERTHRWATWAREPFAGGDYAVSVHRQPAVAPADG